MPLAVATPIFAGAGAYLATSGQSYVDKYMSMLGLKSDPAHHSYLTRFADVAPNMVLTADADKIVEFYRKWASEENWVTVGAHTHGTRSRNTTREGEVWGRAEAVRVLRSERPLTFSSGRVPLVASDSEF